MPDAVAQRGALRRWIADRGVMRRRRLEHVCRDRLAELDLPRPYDEAAWVQHIERLVGWPIKIIDLTLELRRRAVAVNSEHLHGHTFALRDGYIIAVDPTATADSRDLTIAHELAHIAWKDLEPSCEAPSMDAFFRSQGEDIPEVVQFMLAGSGVSRRGDWKRWLTLGKPAEEEAALTQQIAELTKDLDPAEADLIRELVMEKQNAKQAQALMEVRAEVMATLMASWGAPHDSDQGNAVERFWQS